MKIILDPILNDQASQENSMPTAISGSANEQQMYPFEYPRSNFSQYANGGEVKKGKKEKLNPYPMLAEMIRAQGDGEDQILAHINPKEALILSLISGGNINKQTGCPQFGLFSKPGKWLKSVAGPVGGSIIGNMMLPGIGGLLGGALGGAVGNKVRNKNAGAGALKGLGIGAMLPSTSSLLGNLIGGNNSLTNYGERNAILPALNKLFGGSDASQEGIGIASGDNYKNFGHENYPNVKLKNNPNESWLQKLTNKSSDFFSSPKNLLTLASVAGNFLDRPKKQTPERKAQDEKKYNKALMLTPAELAEKEAHDLAALQSKRRIMRNQYLPEERLGLISPLYRMQHSPEEYHRSGKWFSYYDNPIFAGNPIPYKEGGKVASNPSGLLMIHQSMKPIEEDESFFLQGTGGGQDDDLCFDLPEDGYVLDASTVANIGDGNSNAGANKIKAWLSDGEFFIAPHKVEEIGEGNKKRGIKKLDKMVKNIRKQKTAKKSLPSKAKSLTDYMS